MSSHLPLLSPNNQDRSRNRYPNRHPSHQTHPTCIWPELTFLNVFRQISPPSIVPSGHKPQETYHKVQRTFNNLSVPKYLAVPCTTVPAPAPTNIPAASRVLLSCSCNSTGESAANASTFSRATPRAMKPSPVRVQARKVRSEASRSRAREPLLGRGRLEK